MKALSRLFKGLSKALSRPQGPRSKNHTKIHRGGRGEPYKDPQGGGKNHTKNNRGQDPRTITIPRTTGGEKTIPKTIPGTILWMTITMGGGGAGLGSPGPYIGGRRPVPPLPSPLGQSPRAPTCGAVGRSLGSWSWAPLAHPCGAVGGYVGLWSWVLVSVTLRVQKS